MDDITVANAQTCLTMIREGQISVDNAKAYYSQICIKMEDEIKGLLKIQKEITSELVILANKIAYTQEQEETKRNEIAELEQLESQLYNSDEASDSEAVRNRKVEIKNRIIALREGLKLIEEQLEQLKQEEQNKKEALELTKEALIESEKIYNYFRNDAGIALQQLEQRNAEQANVLNQQYNIISDKIAGRGCIISGKIFDR